MRAYIRRNKTDRTDCEALLEADRCGGLTPVSLKSEDQQAIASLHAARSQWMSTRTARINALRALLHEYGLSSPAGAVRLLQRLPEILEQQPAVLPSRVRLVLRGYAEEIAHLEERIEALERELKQVARESAVTTALDSGRGSAERDRPLRGRRRHPHVPQWTAPGQLDGTHAEGALQR